MTLEINKKISEIKLLKDEKFIPRNWAENIADAWELFEEMPHGLIENSIGGMKICSFISEGKSQAIQWYDDTAPLAICKSWLAWKENEK